MRRRVSCSLAFLLAAAPSVALAQNKNWKKELDAQLEQSIQLSKFSPDRFRVTGPGSMFTIQRDGITAVLATDMFGLVNHVTPDGSVRQARGGMADAMAKGSNRDLAIGDRVYVYRLDVRDDGVDVVVLTHATVPIQRNGSTSQVRYQATLRYDFPKDSLRVTDAAAVLARIEQVLQPTASTATAAGVQPKTVELGQTTAQVEAAFGKPEKILKLGAKVIYVYKDVKVTFTDGKVSDVQ
jgi:hypothetical protein